MIFRSSLLCALSLPWIACQSTPDLPLLSPSTEQALPTVRIGPGDELELKFAFTPEHDSELLVRADGFVTVPLLGDFQIAGLTPSEAGESLEQQYRNYLKTPAVSLALQSSYSRKVFVGGYVLRPGMLPMPAELSVLEAILQSGGFDKFLAEPANVVVIRLHEGGRQAFLVDLEKAWRRESSDRFLLQPGDIVHVPQSKIAQLDQWVDQHINRLIPQVGLRYGQDLGSGSVSVGSTR